MSPQKEVGWWTIKGPCPPLSKFTQVRLFESWILILYLEWSNIKNGKIIRTYPWYWERLRARKGGDTWWGGWMASLLQWTWVWANSGRWWRTEKSGILQSMGSQRDTTEWLNNEQPILARALMRLSKSFNWLDSLSSLRGKLFYLSHELLNTF